MSGFIQINEIMMLVQNKLVADLVHSWFEFICDPYFRAFLEIMLFSIILAIVLDSFRLPSYQLYSDL